MQPSELSFNAPTMCCGTSTTSAGRHPVEQPQKIRRGAIYFHANNCSAGATQRVRIPGRCHDLQYSTFCMHHSADYLAKTHSAYRWVLRIKTQHHNTQCETQKARRIPETGRDINAAPQCTKLICRQKFCDWPNWGELSRTAIFAKSTYQHSLSQTCGVCTAHVGIPLETPACQRDTASPTIYRRAWHDFYIRVILRTSSHAAAA